MEWFRPVHVSFDSLIMGAKRVGDYVSLQTTKSIALGLRLWKIPLRVVPMYDYPVIVAINQ